MHADLLELCVSDASASEEHALTLFCAILLAMTAEGGGEEWRWRDERW